MKAEVKKAIVSALESYMLEHSLSAAKVAADTGVNAGYLSVMRKGELVTRVGDKEVEIKEVYFRKLAEYVGYKIEAEYWSLIPTAQFQRVVATLEDARDFGYTSIIIGSTGSGKSYSLNLFRRQHPGDVFVVTVGNSDTINDLVNKTLDELGLPQQGTKSRKIQVIIRHLMSLRYQGYKPLLVFDESEYMKLASLCAMKELYDSLTGHCGLVMIGTEQLIRNLDKLRIKDKDGMPQFYRRVKFGIRQLPPVDKSFKQFLNGYSNEVKRFALAMCDNYGELHDLLVPALREADRTGQELNENFIRTILNMPRA